MTYYHGGAPGLQGYILPPSETGVETFSSMAAEMSQDHALFASSAYMLPTRLRNDRVYVTPDIAIAVQYAWTYAILFGASHGCVYRVEPCSTLTVDDSSPAAYECRAARISAVEIECVEPPAHGTYPALLRMFRYLHRKWRCERLALRQVQ